jgi:alpha-L-fucosidase 2
LQSYNDKIRVFPALPTNANFVSTFTLLAKGGFLVSSEKEANEIKYVGIKSLYGNSAMLANPWGTQQVQVRRTSDNAIITTTSNSEFTFSTVANAVYVIERTYKLLSSYTYKQLTGTANQGEKTLSGTGCKLGANAGSTAAKATFYQDINFGGTAVALNPGNYTTAQLSAAGIPDNWVSSVEVPAGYTVEIYDQDNFSGTKWTFTADNLNFLAAACNDKMSSVKIYVTSGTSTN